MPPMKPGTGLHGPLLLEEPLIRVSPGRLMSRVVAVEVATRWGLGKREPHEADPAVRGHQLTSADTI